MIFTYETQGAITYLVCELEPAEQIDGLSLGMLTNNHIAGLAPVLYTEMNGQRFLKYNISAKISAEQFFGGMMNKQRTLTALQNILSVICSADDYMIDANCFSVAPEHIFINVSSCETAMICIPVVFDKDVNDEVSSFILKMLNYAQFDSNEDDSYVSELISYANSGATFSVYGLRDLVAKLQANTSVGMSRPANNYVQPQVTPSQQPMVPASSFDSTITMDEMNAIMTQQQQVQQAQPPVQQMRPPVQQMRPPVQQMQQPIQQMRPPVQQMQPPVVPTPMQQAGRPINSGSIMQNDGPGTAKAPQTPAIPKPPVSNGPGFAIPGQPMGGAKKEQDPPAKKKKAKAESKANNNNNNNEDKKMSFFGLLSHYNKENAELYKKQKEEAKAKKAASSDKADKTVPQNNVVPTPNGVAFGPGVPNPYQQMAQNQYQQPVIPVPVQNSFNETTVLSPSMMSGETTVLCAEPSAPNPCLIRVKTGERISINKPVFRIGKEKSYVDYFIADNTAISRSHANIHTENGEYFIEDTNSTNHTYINGALISSNVKTKINSGDKVRLANEDFTFSV